jgi:hypothetical protein
MTDSIHIDLGIKKVLINNGPEFIEFNPADIVFAERFYQLIKEFEQKQAEYRVRAQQIDANTAVDATGIPLNVPDGLAMMREACEFMRGQVDTLFGAGTSQKVFGNSLSLDVFRQFFEGISPFTRQPGIRSWCNICRRLPPGSAARRPS